MMDWWDGEVKMSLDKKVMNTDYVFCPLTFKPTWLTRTHERGVTLLQKGLCK